MQNAVLKIQFDVETKNQSNVFVSFQNC